MKKHAALALALFACSSAATDGINVSDAFDPDQRESLKWASQNWTDLTRNPHAVALNGGAWRLVREVPCCGYAGQVDSPSRTIRISPGLDATMFRLVVLHELGHVLGLRHLADASSVMHHETSALDFSRCDEIECVRVGACAKRFDFDPNECPEAP